MRSKPTVARKRDPIDSRPVMLAVSARQKLYEAFCDGAHAFIALAETSVTPATCTQMSAALDALEDERALTGRLLVDMRKHLEQRAKHRGLRVIRGGKDGA